LDKERVRHVLNRLDNFADKLILDGEYYKKSVKEIKAELKKEGLL
jgi:chorismate mutase